MGPRFAVARGGQAAKGEPIKIGYVWGVTGAVAEIVRPASEATRAYFDDLNKRGGINGRPVQMVEIDSKYQVPLAQEGYKKVTTDDRVALVVLASTGDTEALAQQINADRIPTITFSCDEKWAKPEQNPYIFTICTTYQDQMSTALKFVKDRGGDDTRVAFSYADIPFGQAPIPTGRQYAASLGSDARRRAEGRRGRRRCAVAGAQSHDLQSRLRPDPERRRWRIGHGPEWQTGRAEDAVSGTELRLRRGSGKGHRAAGRRRLHGRRPECLPGPGGRHGQGDERARADPEGHQHAVDRRLDPCGCRRRCTAALRRVRRARAS